MDRTVTIKSVLKNGTEVMVTCEFISADADRLYLRYPDDKIDFAQYFYEGKAVDVQLVTINGDISYPALILYEPEDKIIVVEFYKLEDDITNQKRRVFRVKTEKTLLIKIEGDTFIATTIDISAGGIRFYSSYQMIIDKIYTAKLMLNNNEDPLNLEFNVRNSEYLSNDNKYEISAIFTSLNEQDKKKLTKFCFAAQINMVNQE